MPRTGHSIPGKASRAKREDYLPQPAGNAVPDAARDAVYLLGHLRIPGWKGLKVSSGPKAPGSAGPSELLSNRSAPRLY